MSMLRSGLYSLLGASALAFAAVGCSDDDGGDASSSDGGTSAGGGAATDDLFVEERAVQLAAAVRAEMGDEVPSDKTIVYNLVWDDPFFQTIRQGFQVAAQEIGFDAKIVTVEPPWPPEGSLAEFDATGVDAYISHWAGGIYADHPDIPWIVTEPGTDVSADTYVAGISSDNEGISALLSEMMMEQVPESGATIAVYGAADGPGFSRGESIATILEDAGYVVVGAPTTDLADQADKVYSQLSLDVEDYPDIQGVIGTLGFHGGAIASWLDDNGYEPGEIKVVCTDFEADAQPMIEQGYISATAVQRQYWWGYMAAYLAYASTAFDAATFAEITAPYADDDGVVSTDFDAVTPGNYDAYLDFLHSLGVIE